MKDTPINFSVVKSKIETSGIPHIGKATIRELVKLVNEIETETGDRYIRMEMGVPGLPTPKIAIDAEIDAILNKKVTAKYPNLEGLPELKKEISRFVKLFMDIEVKPTGCIPTVGSLQGGLIAFITIDRMYEDKDTMLYIDPSFPLQKQQLKVLGQKFEQFDVYNYRGKKLRDKLESIFKKGNIHSVLYSNPNNPSWICFTEEELQIFGEMANKYNVIIIEDLAYFCMDFRKDLSKPGEPPFQPTVAKYTDNFILLISTSKAFSYAGQRVGMMVISDKLFNLRASGLKRFYTTDIFGYSMIFGTLYMLSAGTCHSAQYGITAILKAANDGTHNFRDDVIEYGRKAEIMKKFFTDNGFKIVYDYDGNDPIAHGFYFTISYPGFTGEELIEELIYYGISAISLSITGSERTEGLRACVSLVQRDQFPDLEYRLKKFNEHHPVK
ncbi:MAG: pyridoxal phosphate-dependent aminotransferase [Bacteroidales bacterium]|nr:pyridoxal phosphate-dependent aminotransferase [Bacteroidales bacterium]